MNFLRLLLLLAAILGAFGCGVKETVVCEEYSVLVGAHQLTFRRPAIESSAFDIEGSRGFD